MFESLGAGADTLTSGARQLGSDAAGLYGRSLAENPITTLGWTGALGVPAAGGVMEGLSALGQYTGMSNPSGNSWYAPHMSSLRFDPNVVGEGSALMNRMTSPFQYLSYLSGNQEGPTGVQQLEGYNPTTGTIGSGGLNANNLKVDPATGRVTLQGEFAPGLNPAIRQQMESRRQLVERLAPQFGFGRQSNKTIPSSRETYNGPLLQVGDT
jgi:hypothetical protein